MEHIKNILRNRVQKLSRFFKTDMMYVAKSGFWLNANFIFVSLFGLLSSVLFAHLVSKEIYGTYQFVLAIAGIIAVFAPNNMSSAVLRAVAQGYEGDFVKATRYQLRWGLIASIISLGASLWYAMHQNIPLSFSLILLAIFMPSTFALNTWNAYIQGKKDYKRYFFYNTLATFISYGGIIWVLLFKREFMWLIAANIIFGFLANLVLYFITVKKMKPNTETDPGTIPYGKHLSIMGIPQGLAGQLDALLIFHYVGAEALAIYSFATLLPEKIAGGLKFIPVITLPKFSEKSEVDVKNFFKRKIWWLLLFLGIMSGLYALAAPYLFKFVFPKYIESIAFTQIYSLSFFAIAASVAQAALVSQRKVKELYLTTIAFPIIKTILMFVLLMIYGVWGVIYAQLITILFQIIFPILLLNRSTPENI